MPKNSIYATCTTQVFSVLSPNSIRLLRRSHFTNLSTLITQATAQLCQVVETPYSIYFDQALNCVRVLTRLLPFVMEDVAESELREEDGLKTAEEREELRAKIEDLCWGEGDIAMDQPGDDGYREPIGLLVVHATMHMLFLPQFTCDYFEEPDDNDEEEDGEADDGEGEEAIPQILSPTASVKLDNLVPSNPPPAPSSPVGVSRTFSSTTSLSQAKPFALHPTTSTCIWAYGPGIHKPGKKVRL